MFLNYYKKKKIKDILTITKRFYMNWDDEICHRYMKMFSLDENKTPSELSSGMKVKLNLVMALSHGAELLILDEPTSGLDPVARDELLDILAEYIEDENRGILFSTHITADVERIADYVTILHNGKVWFTGSRDTLIEKYMVIKGAEEDLPNALKEKCIGFHAYRNGFDALLETTHKNELLDALITEKASIDEILVYIAKEDKRERRSQDHTV